MNIVETPQLQVSSLDKVADTFWKVSVYGPDNYRGAVISDYAYTKNKTLKKSAIQFTKELFSDCLNEDIDDKFAEDAIQYLIRFKHDFPFPKPTNPKFTFIDLFAGIGGFRIAMQKLGGECVFTSEWDKHAQQTYYANFGDVPFGDITKPEIKKYIPKEFQILCAGFPCQPFSRAGVAARNYLGLQHGFDHPTQGNLFFDIIEITEKHQPEVLFLENVKNLKSHDNGNTFKKIEFEIRNLGYSFYHAIINAQTEVPQRRQRTYMVCFKDQSKQFEFPEFSGQPKKLGDYLETDVPDSYTLSDAMWQGHIKRSKRNKERGVGFSLNIADISKPAHTIVARYYKDGKECLIPQEGRNPRMLTLRESARLQGFSENFIYHKNKKYAYQQFGNSVAVPVIQKIGSSIVHLLSK